MAVGYSGTPLHKKLGMEPGKKLIVINPPGDYESFFEEKISSLYCKKNEVPDIIHAFAPSMKTFLDAMKKIIPYTKKNSSISIWISWYKKASKIPTDITEDSIRNYALPNNLVDVKVCAVSEIWSGLKLVIPLAKRNRD